MANFLDNIMDPSVHGLHKNLDIRKKRAEAILSNIANAETPGYKASDVNFGGELERAFQRQAGTLRKTNGKHMDISAQNGSSHLVADNSGATRADGNNVDIDLQMAKLTSNSGKYSGSASMVRKKLNMLRQAIRYAQR